MNRIRLNPLLFSLLIVVTLISSGPVRSHSESSHSQVVVNFENSCAPEVAQAFNEAVSLLHNMTYHVAESKFEAILESDPECGMAYWGIAMSYIHPLWFEDVGDDLMQRGSELLAKARQKELSERESDYVTAVEAFYELRGAPLFDRLDAYAAGFARVHENHPDDLEAKAFFALTHLVNQRPGTVNLPVVEASLAASEAVLEESPNHPGAHHYIIHALDTPELADRAEDIARNYAVLAPENPHALHMPTHIFTRLGLWQASIELNIRSAQAALAMPFGEAISMHYPHALDYLLFGYLQTGQESLARQAVDDLLAIEMPVEVSPATAYHLAAVEARWTLERHQWAEAALVEARRLSDFPWDLMPQFEANAHFAVALGGARSGNVSKAEQGIHALAQLEEQTSHPYWKKQVQVMRLSAEGWLAQHNGNFDDAAKLLNEATQLEAGMTKHAMTPGEILPANELLGDLMLAQAKPDKALKAYKMSLSRTPNRFNSLYGAALAARELGREALAMEYFEQLIKVCSRADTDREELKYAKVFVADSS